MNADEEKIRDLVSRWMAATRSGDVDTVLGLMTEEAVFLVAGQPVMRKPDFAAAARAQANGTAPTFDGTSDIQEIIVSGDWAFMWSWLSVTATPADGGKPTTRAGHTLTVFHKQNDQWLLARDANLLAPVQTAAR